LRPGNPFTSIATTSVPPGRLYIDPALAPGSVGIPHDLPALPGQVPDEHCLHARLGVPVTLAGRHGQSGGCDVTRIWMGVLFGVQLAATDDHIKAHRGKHSPRHLSSEPASRDTRHHFKGLFDRVERRTDLDRVLVKGSGRTSRSPRRTSSAVSSSRWPLTVNRTRPPSSPFQGT
jgi:hypothetical protein